MCAVVTGVPGIPTWPYRQIGCHPQVLPHPQYSSPFHIEEGISKQHWLLLFEGCVVEGCVVEGCVFEGCAVEGSHGRFTVRGFSRELHKMVARNRSTSSGSQHAPQSLVLSFIAVCTHASNAVPNCCPLSYMPGVWRQAALRNRLRRSARDNRRLRAADVIEGLPAQQDARDAADVAGPRKRDVGPLPGVQALLCKCILPPFSPLLALSLFSVLIPCQDVAYSAVHPTH